jgi:hypothetical protein
MNTLVKSIRNPDLVDDLLKRLDEKAFNYNPIDYGLPVDSPLRSDLREIVYRWLDKLDDADRPVCPKCDCSNLTITLTCPNCGLTSKYIS